MKDITNQHQNMIINICTFLMLNKTKQILLSKIASNCSDIKS